jgi:hypothetical protein
MTPLRRRMTEDMTVRNFSPYTQRGYLFAVARFARHFNTSPAELGPEHVREYLNLLILKAISASYFNINVAALRFLYTVTLEREWMLTKLPFQKRPRKLPIVLSIEEVTRFLAAVPDQKMRAVMVTAYATGLRVFEVVALRVLDIDNQRMVLRVAEGNGGGPVDTFGFERRKPVFENALGNLAVGQRIFDHIIEPAIERGVEQFRVVRCGNNQAVAVIGFEELQERIEDAADLANIVTLVTLRTDRVELIEEIDAPGFRDGVEHQTQLGRGLAHELGHEAVKDDGEQRHVQFTGQRRRRHRLAGAGRTQQQQLAPRAQPMAAQPRLLALFDQHAAQPLLQRRGQHHAGQPGFGIAGINQTGEVAARLGQRHRLARSRAAAAPRARLVHQFAELLR